MNRRLWLVIIVITLMAALGGFWQWLVMGDSLNAEKLEQLLSETISLRHTWWAPPLLMVIYPVGSLVLFPLTILVGATGLIFGPWWGLFYAVAGTMVASSATWLLGRMLGRDLLEKYGGERIRKLADSISRYGIRTMILFNLLPLAPFTFTNMIAGAARMPYATYMIGSLIGILPGLAAVTIAGSRLGELLRSRSMGDLLWLGVAIAAVIGLAALTRWIMSRRQRL
ncbi:TVP38/TMEM64 family protein [Kushneria aurantia]|uniref:TVP38/TMEM64 family membrane protein n=1 Tax=Kushneria aurantia TaxID=504092 RepID=A0ABV6G7V3_9GAMM|nr:TVP38/TMEM64 family protein [Kushneria aurantia]